MGRPYVLEAEFMIEEEKAGSSFPKPVMTKNCGVMAVRLNSEDEKDDECEEVECGVCVGIEGDRLKRRR